MRLTTEKEKRPGGNWKETHKDRYGNAKNPNMDKIIAAKLQPVRQADGKLPCSKIVRASKSNHNSLAKWDGIKEGICPKYSAGYCFSEGCTMCHLWGKKLPQGYPKWHCNQIDDGVHVMGSEPSPKRHKTGEGTESE